MYFRFIFYRSQKSFFGVEISHLKVDKGVPSENILFYKGKPIGNPLEDQYKSGGYLPYSLHEAISRLLGKTFEFCKSKSHLHDPI